MIKRILEDKIYNSLTAGKVIGLFGPRRTGKTVLLQQLEGRISGKVLSLTGDDLDAKEIFSQPRLHHLSKVLQGYDYLFLDEAQNIPDIGNSLKLIVDNLPSVSVFITGSASLNLKNKTGEPLTGRSKYFTMFPVSETELNEDYLRRKINIKSRLIFGSYPQIITAENDSEKKDILNSIKNGYLLKDILELNNLKDSLFVLNLLRLIAFQIGKNVSYSELASNLSVSKNTVMRYVDLLEKSFVLFSLNGFSRNLRKEFSKSPRYYFYDNGIRNCIISNYNPLNLRDDIGQLWENYCIAERLKIGSYNELYSNYYFWRTYDMQEIDLIEEREGKLFAFEFKWKKVKKNPPPAFKKTYPDSVFNSISMENFDDLLKIH